MFEWINLAILISSLLTFLNLYGFSVMPVIRGERKGKEIWSECRNLRIIT
jgi:hypothetical protein